MSQSTLETRTIAELRKSGLDKQTLEKVAAERVEMERAEREQKTRMPGSFLSLKDDGETRTFFFTGKFDKVTKPMVDWQTKQEIPGRIVTKYRFQVYDTTNPNNPSPEPAIWERGATEARKVFRWFSEQKTELTIIRNGVRNSQTTNYDIFPVNR